MEFIDLYNFTHFRLYFVYVLVCVMFSNLYFHNENRCIICLAVTQNKFSQITNSYENESIQFLIIFTYIQNEMEVFSTTKM